ncbi:MAG: 16S rRNA (cytidine(1402)-2'-O)-methyltransferase, partial [Ilumatobacteraceae bacterium]
VAHVTAAPAGTGTLVLVATPIGNLGDLPPRAIEALRSATLICCEDTRRTGKLLQHAGISGVRMAVANEHTERDRIEQVLQLLDAGNDVAFVSDAGTPGISDPGERLVRAAVDHGHRVSAVPGPAALIMALVISGFDTTRFVFEGFVPRSGSDRTRRLADVATERRTTILYEAPHRVARTITDLVTHCGPDRRVVLARELTKLHEEVWRGTLAEATVHLAEREPRGEYVLILEAAPAGEPADDDAITRALQRAMADGDSRKAAIATVTAALGVAKRRVFDIATSLPRVTADQP